MGGTGGILVVAEQRHAELAPISLELLGAGRALARASGDPVVAALAGAEDLAHQLVAGGADRVIVLDHPALEHYAQEPFLAAFEQLARKVQPRAMLLGHTPIGRDLAPRLAVRLDVGLATDVIALAFDATQNVIIASKPVFGGLAISELVPSGRPQVFTLRARTQEPLEAQAGRTGGIDRFTPDLRGVVQRTKVIERVREKAPSKRLEDAEIVVACGRGLGGPEGVRLLEELAASLDGVVGASRAAVDAGWIAGDQQVGLTGKITRPKLYVAVGISGAMQHMTGCSGAQVIVAINSDRGAPIFERAHFGIVADYRGIVPALAAVCRELRKP